jgi:hypothetical protein
MRGHSLNLTRMIHLIFASLSGKVGVVATARKVRFEVRPARPILFVVENKTGKNHPEKKIG